jgi:hypothetical protein
MKTRVENWINVVLAGNDPRTASDAPAVANTVASIPAQGSEVSMTSTAKVDTEEDNIDDLPF